MVEINAYAPLTAAGHIRPAGAEDPQALLRDAGQPGVRAGRRAGHVRRLLPRVAGNAGRGGAVVCRPAARLASRVPRHRSGQHPAPDLRHARPDRLLHPPLPPLLPLGITQTPPPDLPAGVPCVYPRKFQKDFSKKLLRGEGTAEDDARRIQSRASLYMTEQYG